jgi:hypothetical protein
MMNVIQRFLACGLLEVSLLLSLSVSTYAKGPVMRNSCSGEAIPFFDMYRAHWPLHFIVGLSIALASFVSN